MGKEQIYQSKQPEISKVFEEIKSVDTSGYNSNPMVEKLLVNRVEELTQEINQLKDQVNKYSHENSALKVEIAVLKERKSSGKILELVRNITGIAMGISGGLIFSQENLLSKAGVIATPFLGIIFTVVCLFPFTKKYQNE